MSRTAWIVGNSPFYQALTKMAENAGLSVKLSFNCDYEDNLPKAKGDVLLVEVQKGTPIVSLDLLEKYFPGCTRGVTHPDASVEIDGTTIVFVDFARPLQRV